MTVAASLEVCWHLAGTGDFDCSAFVCVEPVHLPGQAGTEGRQAGQNHCPGIQRLRHAAGADQAPYQGAGPKAAGGTIRGGMQPFGRW